MSVCCFEYIFAVRVCHQQSSHLNLSQFCINKECYSINCWCEFFMSAGSPWQQRIHPKEEEHLLKGHQEERPSKESPLCWWAVSLNKSVEPPSYSAGLFSAGSPQWDPDRLVGHKGFSFPGVLTGKWNSTDTEKSPHNDSGSLLYTWHLSSLTRILKFLTFNLYTSLNTSLPLSFIKYHDFLLLSLLNEILSNVILSLDYGILAVKRCNELFLKTWKFITFFSSSWLNYLKI